jgi:hypothetical protein
LDETTARQTGQGLGDLLAIRPAGPVRAVTHTAEFSQAYAQFQGGNFADAARLVAAAARSTEFQNLRGQSVRVIEIISPVSGGVSLRRVVVLSQPNDQAVGRNDDDRPTDISYWRTDVEIDPAGRLALYERCAGGNTRCLGASKFSLERRLA